MKMKNDVSRNARGRTYMHALVLVDIALEPNLEMT